MIAGTTRQPDLVVRLTSSDVRTFDGPGLAGSTGLNWEVRPTGIGGRDGTGFKTGRVVSAGVNQTQRAVLDSLEGGPTSGPELADELGISRSAVWNGVETLREAGFEIGSSEEGYVLTAIPEYGAGAVEHRLDGEFTVEYHDSIPSTNARARELAHEERFDPESESGVVVLADEQTGGRGRLDREWASPPGGIWMSILLRPDLPPAQAPLLTLAAAVATARAVDDVGVGDDADRDTDGQGTTMGLKWPNDVLAVGRTGEERKLAGILTEMEGETDEVSWVIVGIGLNANVDVAGLPDGATSLRELAGDVNRGRLVATLLEAFDALRAAPEEILTAWRERSLTLGRQVRVETESEAVVGEAAGIDPPGALLVDTGSEVVRVHAGDCEHLRRDER
jgi:BirA family biotin operon repressor/biotin-[acetyl-CoA-carboxylase] ligase